MSHIKGVFIVTSKGDISIFSINVPALLRVLKIIYGVIVVENAKFEMYVLNKYCSVCEKFVLLSLYVLTLLPLLTNKPKFSIVRISV